MNVKFLFHALWRPFQVVTLTVVALLVSFPLMAQERSNRSDESETVTNRGRPKLDPTGIRLGGFFLYPTLDLELRNDDNIFAADNATSDDIFLINPGFSLRSNWNVHQLSVFGNVSSANYSDFSDEDRTDYNLGARGVIEVDRLREIELNAGIGRSHEDRGSADDFGGDEPTEIDRSNIGAIWRHELTRLGYEFGANVRNRSFEDGRNGGLAINNGDRDRDITELSGEVNYRVSPDYRLFLRGVINSRSYDQEFDDDGFQRSSDGVSVLGGAKINLSGITSGEVYVGRRDQDYDDPRFQDIDGGVLGANITWNPTGLTTVNFLADRTIDETTSTDSAGYLRSSYGVTVDHELYRNLLLHGGIGAYDDEYQGINRDDDHTWWRLGATYLANRSLRLYLTYDSLERDSTFGRDFSYERDRVSFRVRLMR